MRQALIIPIADIGELPADQYVGLIDESAVSCLTVRLAAEGLLTPIWLRRNGNAAKFPWSVIAGRHRLLAATSLGWSEIAAQQRADVHSTEEELQRLQVAENLDRRILRPIERSNNIMCRWRQEAAHRAWDIVSHARDLDQVTAGACGTGDRTIRRYRRLHEEIVVALPDLFAALNAHQLGESFAAMTRLATLNEIARRKAAEAILSRNDWVSIDQVLSTIGIAASTGNRVDPEKLGAVMMNAWGKMPLTGRRAHVEWLVENVTPGMALDMVAGFKRRGLLP